MRLEPSTKNDLSQLSAWIAADDWHRGIEPEFWLTGADCLLAAKVLDKDGVVAYLRVDEENDDYRIHGQFGPEYDVSKTRTAKAILKVIDLTKQLAVSNSKKSLIIQTTNAPLIAFLSRLQFKPCEDEDYIWKA
jgi:hypothetical protein